jgi:hypothetical protein
MAGVFAVCAGLVAVYFLQRENQMLREELRTARQQAPLGTNSNPTIAVSPRWIPGGSEQPVPLPVVSVSQNAAPDTADVISTPHLRPAITPEVKPAHPSHLLSGKVIDEGGAPISKARVEVTLPENHEKQPGPVMTDATGRFRFPSIPVDHVTEVRVRADGFGTLEMKDVPLPLDDLEMTMNRLVGLDIRVLRQLDGGALSPVQELITLIILRAPEGTTGNNPGLLFPVSTDALTLKEGKWRTGQLEPANYRVGVVASDGDYAESEPIRLDAVRGGETEVVLGRRQQLSGVVRSDPDRTLLTNAQLTLVMTSRPKAAGEPRPIEGRTGTDGTFVVDDVPPGIYSVTLSADHHTTKVLEGIPVVAGPPPKPAIFFLRKTYPGVTITVRNATGETVPGSPVTVAAIGQHSPATGPWFGQTGDDGTFSVESIPPGRYALSASLPGARGRQRMREATIAGPGRHSLEIRFLNQVEIKGRILRQGTPYTGSVSLRAKDSVVAESVLKTDSQGLFSTLIEPGEWIVTPLNGTGTAPLRVDEAANQALEITLR